MLPQSWHHRSVVSVLHSGHGSPVEAAPSFPQSEERAEKKKKRGGELGVTTKHPPTSEIYLVRDAGPPYLHDCLEHGYQHKLDETNLCCGFGHFVTIHEGSDGKPFRFFPVTLMKKNKYQTEHRLSVFPTPWSNEHKWYIKSN